MAKRYLAQRAASPRLSEMLNGVYDILQAVQPNTNNFLVMFRDTGDVLQTRIMPVDDKTMDDLYTSSEDEVNYVATTDENNNFVGEEIR